MATASCDFVVYHDLANRPLQVRKGDQLKIVKKEDVLSVVKFLEGEAKSNRTHTIDNYCIDFEENN